MQSFFPRLNVVEREIVLAAFNAADRSFAGVAQTLRQFALRKTNFFSSALNTFSLVVICDSPNL